jgi:superfamily II DNA/RNA helicase
VTGHLFEEDGMMEIRLDKDVEKVIEFMNRNIAQEKLLFVATALAQIAGLAWQHCQPVPEVLPALTIGEKPLAPFVDGVHG